jgi:hypothetical protein
VDSMRHVRQPRGREKHRTEGIREAVVSTLLSQMKHADQADDNEIDRDNEIQQTRDN